MTNPAVAFNCMAYPPGLNTSLLWGTCYPTAFGQVLLTI